MKQLIIVSFLLLGFSLVKAQEPTAKELYQTARSLMQQGDYDNASIAFNKTLALEPNNTDVLKDYAYLNCLKKDYDKAIIIGKSLVEKQDADVQSYQILGFAYKGSGNVKDCAKLYQVGLEKYPNSGVLYNEYGELLARDNNLPIAILEWEAGIKADPNYSSNYYNAAMYYSRVGNTICWVLLYGEVFVNLESYTQRTAEMKSLLLDTYKKIFTVLPLETIANDARLNGFEKAFYQTLLKSKSIANAGVSPETITAIRARFILDWFANKDNDNMPFHLFLRQQYFLREGLFDAYSQWIFGAAASPTTYQYWLNTHNVEAAAYKTFQQGRVYKILGNQYYK